ncbi:MAG: carbamoyl-phosphate synthase (glutamine-hydrolyzing) large subunit [Desulfurococcaceae archaeon]
MEMPRKVLVIGSGAIKIAEAAEFDYSGNQALKALKEEGIETILVNPNIATIQTSYKFADKVYLTPLKPVFIAKIIEKERPDGVMLGFGGQTALSLGVRLHDDGVFDKYGIKVLGTPINGIKKALSRELFRKTAKEYNLPIPPSMAVHSVEEALSVAEIIGYPVMVRVSFNLGGAGSFVAWSKEELARKAPAAFAQSEIGEVLVEKYLYHWKEIEFEVVRDMYDNTIAVACMENLDPMGVHTGESVVIAPCQTLTDYEYQLSRNLSIATERAIMLIGEGNVQLALNSFNSDEIYVIETNPRMSRSSALASKATGYPLAYIAAKLALGYRLYEVVNKVTGVTSACFEPSLDYVVVKIPRWDLDKFEKVERSIGTEMKSVGEVMAIGRTFQEALQKAIRMLDIGEPGVVGGGIYNDDSIPIESVLDKLKRREPYWPIWVAKAFKHGVGVEAVYNLTGIDKHFLLQIKEIVDFYEELRKRGINDPEIPLLISRAKSMGFSDEQLARALEVTPDDIRALRIKHGIRPVIKQIDTLAAEWPAHTNYLYLTYNGWENDISTTSIRPKIMVLGAGGFRIGVSVEFDWSIVTFADEARALGFEVIVVNYNPETVSTDWDMNDKLYFDEVSIERVLDIYEAEKPLGVVAFLGGQISNNIAWELEKKGIPLLGTPGRSIHVAENRALFSDLLDKLNIKQPDWIAATDIKEVLRFVEEKGFPVLVRPSYVLSGSSMTVARDTRELLEHLSKATKVSPKYPVVISKFIENSIEFEFDGVGLGETIVGAFIEHVEPAGIHSGDSTMILPPRYLERGVVKKAANIVREISRELFIKGPFNLQVLYSNGEIYVIELNLRASRSMPFTSKVTGFNLMKASAKVVLKGEIDGIINRNGLNLLKPKWYGVKSPQFSWSRLRGAYPFLGPEMRSVGEVAFISDNYEEALLMSWLSVHGNRLPKKSQGILVYNPVNRDNGLLDKVAEIFEHMGYRTYTIEGMVVRHCEVISKTQAINEVIRRNIGLVITTGYSPWRDYDVRRSAADLDIPLILNDKLAHELANAVKHVDVEKVMIKDMKEYWKDLDNIIEFYG